MVLREGDGELEGVVDSDAESLPDLKEALECYAACLLRTQGSASAGNVAAPMGAGVVDRVDGAAAAACVMLAKQRVLQCYCRSRGPYARRG